jgi:hypothetical protein
VQALNLAVRFALELAMLVALSYWGLRTGRTLAGDVLLGVGTPAAAAAIWGRLVAPKSEHRLHGGALIAVQVLLLATGAVALIAAGRTGLGVVFAAVVAINAMLLHEPPSS